MLKTVLFILLAALGSGCIGTVDKATPEKTDFLDPAIHYFKYQGIVDARAISHDKIEVDFYPAGDAKKFTHFLYVNDNPKPVELQLETIKMIQGGVYRYILKHLGINSSYKLKVSAINNETSKVSEGESVKIIKTFDNTTADFQGISRVIPIPGATSSSVKVDWNPADFIGAISATAYDPVHYKVTFISEAGGPENLNNPMYSGSDRFEVRVPSSGQIGPGNHPTEVNVSSLAPDTTYYFQVRAIHKTYNDFYKNDPNNIPISAEANTIYIQYKTDPAGGAVDFDKKSLRLSKAPGQQAFNGIRATWDIGEGTYTHYRLYAKEFMGGDVLNEDELDKPDLSTTAPTKLNYPCETVGENTGLTLLTLPTAVKDDPTLIACFDIPTTTTNVQVNGLVKYTHYQFKVALCRDNQCEVTDGAPNQGILSEVRHERTAPNLAPFDGINTITQPSVETDAIHLNFNSVVVSQGYANTLELYCIDPDNPNMFFLMDANGGALTGTGTYCDGASALTSNGFDLSAINSYGQIASVTKIKISGVKTVNTDPAANYCFGITPAITGATDAPEGDIRMPAADWVVRCIQPELELPTNQEFPGLEGNCSVNQDQVTLSWNEPTGGLFDDYTVFYKKRDNNVFSFASAKNGDPEYVKVPDLTTLGTVIEDLDPGYSYQFGVLASLDSSGTELYSESNVNIKECFVQMPKATFKEWTRAFAIGPKVDGRIPTRNYTEDDNPWPTFKSPDFVSTDLDSRIFEAISIEGIPYEVPADDLNNVNNYFTNPPGEDTGAFIPGNIASFDGALGAAGVAASNTGIISLAWRHVELEFLDAKFTTEQDGEVSDRAAREFGYRIYRSSDYGSSWVDVSETLVKAIDYSYRPRSNEAPTTEKMAFFTDYSVRHLYDYKEIARARIYLYKIVPVYGGKELSYTGAGAQPHNVIRVTLPPPNMALVQRQMANRTLCLELDKTIETANHYVCEYNGLGAKARGIPWQLNQTVIDLGGDMLVDRFELGCNYTRGELTGGSGSEYKSGSSYFAIDGFSGSGVQSENGEFTGLAKNGSAFRGCRPPDNGQSPVNIPGIMSDENNPYNGTDPTYSQVLYGDCMGENGHAMPSSHDTDPGDLRGSSSATIVIPGARDTSGMDEYDETVLGDPWDPQFAYDFDAANPGLYGKDVIRHSTSQGEFAAVFFNRTESVGQYARPFGPGLNQSYDGVNVVERSGYSVGSQRCFVNLASIGNTNDGNLWRSRWFSANIFPDVVVKDSSEESSRWSARRDIGNMTLEEIVESRGLYDDNKASDDDKNFKRPPEALWNLNRIDPSMPLNRVVSSNAAKLPPLTGINKRSLNNICNSYKVQVGVGDDDGAFQAFAAPKGKRLMRRSEFLLAGRYPAEIDNSDIALLERGSVTANTINGSTDNTCVGESRTSSMPIATQVGGVNGANFATLSGETKGLYFTGSGALDGADHTETCASKFGVQDMAGNALEINTDELFCDYNSEDMGIYFGIEFNPGRSVVSPYSDPDALNAYIAQGAYICYAEYPENGGTPPADCSNCTWADPDGDGTDMWCDMTGSLKPWKRTTSYAGYCSIVDDDASKIDDALNFRDVSQVFEPIYNPDGSVNNKPVSRTKVYDADQESVNTMRNGDGFFLNFGESNLAPSFKTGGGLDFINGTGKYFNPIVGIPLTCASYGSRESCGVTAGDNRLASLQGLWDNHGGGGAAPGLSIDDFPVGNAQATNTGLSDTMDNTSAKNVSAPTTNYIQYITRGFIKSASGVVTPVTEQQTVDELAYQYRWTLERDTVLSMFSGGSYAGLKSSLYSLEVTTNGQSTSSRSGGRCAVMINQGY